MNAPPHTPTKNPANRIFVGFIAVISAILIIFLITQLLHIKLPGFIINSQPNLYRVVDIDDGDTVVVDYGGKREPVRLLGIDTPEIKDPRKPVQCFGREATAKTKQLLGSSTVRLVPDHTNSDRDKYGRLLRYIYLPDGTFINAEIVKNGYGFAYTVFPLVKKAEFVSLENHAKAHKLGLWSACKVDDTSKIKQTNDL